MNKHICTICNNEYKYASYLQRHIQSKKKCNKNINNANINTPFIKPFVENNVIQNNQIQTDVISVFNIFDIFKKFIDITKQKDKETEYFELLNNYLKNNNINHQLINNQINEHLDNNQTINKNKSNEHLDDNQTTNKTQDNIKDIKKEFNCNKCNKIFSSCQSLSNHKQLQRCKGIKINENQLEEEIKNGLSFNDIVNSNVTDFNNVTNNINNTTNINGNHIINNTTHNNITININPFGCESLQHISIKEFSSIFKNFDQLNIILYKLSSLIYIKNNNNMNFTKHNMNKSIITYLAKDMELKTLSEREFIKEFENNIRKLCIELFYIHKNNLSVNELIECMKSLLLYYERLSDSKSKLTKIDLKEQLKSIMDSVFRNEDIKVILKQVEKDLLNNPELKNKCKNKNVKRVKEQNKSLDDYYYKPKEDNADEKNLNRIKEKAFSDNISDNKKFNKF